MKSIFTILIFATSVQSFAASANEPTVVKDQTKIMSILSTYVLFSNKIVAQGLAFGFTPIVQEVKIEFENIVENPEFPECSVGLTAIIGKVEGGKVLPVDLPVDAPKEFYVEEGDCKQVKDGSGYL